MKLIIAKYKTLIAVIIVLFLSACVNNTPVNPEPSNAEIENPTSSEIPATNEPIITETIIESKTLFIYLINSEMYLKNSEKFNAIVSKAEELGYEVTQSSELSESQQPISIVILFDPDDQTISHFDTESTGQLIIVGEELINTSQRPTTFIKASVADKLFIAGYFSSLITNDWRVGGLLPSTIYQNTAADLVFKNGVIYLCGRCLPTFGPIVNFPVTATLSNPDDLEGTMQAYGEITNSRVNSLFIPSEYLYDDLITILKQNNVTIISDSELGSDQADWIDYAVTDNLHDLLINVISKSPQNEDVELIQVDYSFFSRSNNVSPGKITYISEMIENLKSGFISPYQISLD